MSMIQKGSCDKSAQGSFSTANSSLSKDRLYGRHRGHPLRDRQKRLLADYLPRIKFPIERVQNPFTAFGKKPQALWLEIGFGGGEHSLAQYQNHPEKQDTPKDVLSNQNGFPYSIVFYLLKGIGI